MKYADRVKESTSTTGTGTLTLAGAAVGYRTFLSALTDGDMVPYVLEDADGIAWETGIGTYSAGTLARTVITASSNAAAAINLPAGSHTVYLGIVAHVAKHHGALVSKTTEQIIPNGSVTPTAVTYDSEQYDTDGFHSTSSNTERFTPPNWASKIRLTAGVTFNANSTGERAAYFYKNGAAVVGRGLFRVNANATSVTQFSLVSAVLEHTAGDYYDVRVLQTCGGDLALQSSSTNNWFSIEVIE